MKNTDKNCVLVVDDEAANIIALTNILSSDYTVYVAKNGTNAVKVAKDKLPDVILLDVLMPEMSGYEVISVLKKTEETCGIPVIFVTGLGTEEYEEKGLGLGASDYISKPFSSAIVKLRVLNQIKIVNYIRTINNISTTDQLTGVPNRRGFDKLLNREWGRAARERMPLSILFIDVDKFKIYNDTYGHKQGDLALQSVAGTIESSLKRSSDCTARWGGEEFAVLLSNTGLSGALKIAEKIRANIEQSTISLVSGDVTKVTASIGVNTLTPAKNCSLNDFIVQADKALYTAKETGRNRVCHNNQNEVSA